MKNTNIKAQNTPARNRQNLLKLARETGGDYYEGLRTFNQPRPDNIILFCRTSHTTSYYAIHHRHVLVFNLGTDGTYCINNKITPFPENTSILIFPYQYHYVISLRKKLNWLYVTFEMPENETLTPLRAQPRMITDETRRRMFDCLSTYLAPLPATERANELALRVALVLNSLPHAPPTREPAGDTEDIKSSQTHYYHHSRIMSKLNQHIQAHPTDHLTAEKLAAAAGISASHLRLVFRKQMKISLGRYIRIARIQKATVLLRKSTLSIKEIATTTGFASTSSFDQTFLRETGVTPAAFRANA